MATRTTVFASNTAIGAPYVINSTSIALGTTTGSATAAGTRGIAIGKNASASATDSIAIGCSGSTASAQNAIMLGGTTHTCSGIGAIAMRSSNTQAGTIWIQGRALVNTNNSANITAVNAYSVCNTNSVLCGIQPNCNATNSVMIIEGGHRQPATKETAFGIRFDWNLAATENTFIGSLVTGISPRHTKHTQIGHDLHSGDTGLTWTNNVLIGRFARGLGNNRLSIHLDGTTTPKLRTDFVITDLGGANPTDPGTYKMLNVEINGTNYKIPLYT